MLLVFAAAVAVAVVGVVVAVVNVAHVVTVAVTKTDVKDVLPPEGGSLILADMIADEFHG